MKLVLKSIFSAGKTLEFGALPDDGLRVEVERRLGSGGQNNPVTQVQGLDCPTRNQYFVRQSDELRRAVQVFQLVQGEMVNGGSGLKVSRVCAD